MAKFFTPTKLSENIKKTPEGYLLCLGVPIARTGWQEYGPGETPLDVGDDGRVWIYRDPKEVFRPQTIASFMAKSITIKHPDDFVTPANWKELTYGSLQNVRKGPDKDDDGEEMLLADFLVTDEMAIGLVENGLREVSCGYDAEYEETAAGEGVQINIIGNHCALVEQGRAGPVYAIKDHKGKVIDPMKLTLKDLQKQLKALSQTVDEAMSDDETDAQKKAALAKKKAKTGDTVSDEDRPAYDEMMTKMSDMMDAMTAMGKSKDESEKEEKSEDDGDNEMLSRLKALEAAVAKILKGSSEDDDEEEEESEDEDMEEESDMSGDEDMEEGESEDADEEEEKSEKKKTGDAAMIEILTPGKKFTGTDARAKCLRAFAKTSDGAKILKKLGLKKPVFDSKSSVNMIFMAASALVKNGRGSGLAGTKDGSKFETEDFESSPKTPSAEDINEMNAKHYASK